MRCIPNAQGSALHLALLSTMQVCTGGQPDPEKPGEIPVPLREPETVPAKEPGPATWPQKDPEIYPGKEPLTTPSPSPAEVPARPATKAI